MPTQFRKVFEPRRRRSFLHFRRKSDAIVLFGGITMFVLGAGSLVSMLLYWQGHSTVRPVRRPDPAPLPQPEPLPAPVAAKPRPRPRPEPEPPAEVFIPEPAPPPVRRKPEPVVERPAPKKPAPKPAKFVPAPEPPAPVPELPPFAGPVTVFQPDVSVRAAADRNSELLADSVIIEGQRGLQMDYTLGEGTWVRVNVPVKNDLRGARRLQVAFRGEGNQNTVDIGFIDEDGTAASVSWPGRSGVSNWTTADVPISVLGVAGGNGKMDWENILVVYFRILRTGQDEGGSGRVVFRGVKIL